MGCDVGMTDKQYESGQRRLLRLLEIVKEELDTKHQVASDKLNQIINDIEDELKRP